MKKALSLILVLVLCVGLCACNKPGEETEGMTKDKMITSATILKCGQLHEDYNENIVNANEKYIGKAFKVTGWIFDISVDHISLTPLVPGVDGTTFEGCSVYLENEDLKKVKKGEIITVVGEISAYHSSNMFAIEMRNAYLVDNVVSITATVGEITYYTGGYHYVPLTTVYEATNQGKFIAQEYWYKIGGTFGNMPDKIVIEGVEVKEGDTVRMEITGEKNNNVFNGGGYGIIIFPMFITTVNSIEKV